MRKLTPMYIALCVIDLFHANPFFCPNIFVFKKWILVIQKEYMVKNAAASKNNHANKKLKNNTNNSSTSSKLEKQYNKRNHCCLLVQKFLFTCELLKKGLT